ncbi:hypothetical protein [Marinomonas spartinae]|uniref:hypothetical protein n=1 Tax=Marinomonas spartinae TaxID=1792290 RepID=UPI0018F193EF|nr:hypothetical protein [Marinomonas spartinae]MBJ7555112.1 hypothetical protein [Marinomonas spartinae]
MDSQDQYEALLKAWGFEDRSVERQARREKIARVAKIVLSFCKDMILHARKPRSHATSH